VSHVTDPENAPLPHIHRRDDDPPATLAEQATEAGLTEEQLAFFTEQTRRAVSKALRKFALPALSGYVALLVGLVIAFGANANTSEQATQAQHDSRVAIVASGRAVAVDGCNRDFRSTDKFRGLLVRLKVATEVSKTSTPAQKAAGLKFYDTTIADQKYPNCAAARSIITDDPKKPVVVPTPLVAKDAKNDDVDAAAKRIKAGQG
jgi:hypothetical protein